MFTSRPVRAVLFDLDGTLADTSPDLSAAANAMRITRQRAPLPEAVLRPWASHGARGLIGAAFGIGPDDVDFPALRDEFLSTYAQSLCVRTSLFDGMGQVLERFETSNIAWGVVTNKPMRFTDPLMDALGLSHRAGAIVSGDTTAQAKPHPLPLLHALEMLGLDDGESCVYVGDDERDIVAGRAAGMRTVAAAYGYCAKEDPACWQADAVIHAPLELLALLGLR